MYRVVIVEDDPMVSLLNRTFVERDARFQVVQSFQDGRAALAWLEQNPADLAVLDVYMPLFTGLELLHALRGQGVGIDAIMVTAANDAPTVDTLLKLGVVDYLVKPFTYERFQQALDTFCRHRDAVAGDAVEQSALDRLFSPALPAEHQPPKETIPIQSENLVWKERGRFPIRAAPFVTSREASRTWKGGNPRKGRRPNS